MGHRHRVRSSLGVVALCGSLGLVAPADAAVTLGPERIEVEVSGDRAVIDRAPFRLSVVDDAGRTVLSQVVNDRPAPFPIPPATDPNTPAGIDGATRPTLYSPLTFTVGARADAQDPATLYNGNQLLGAQSGVQHSAQDVVDARAEGDTLRLELSTSDPTRRLVVTVGPGPRGTLRVTARPDRAEGVSSMGDSFSTDSDEAFRGFGGRHNALDQRGEDFYNWAEQENFSAGPFQPLIDPIPGSDRDRYQFPNGATAAYHPQALFVSSRRYGFLLERPELSLFRMASDRPDAWQVENAAPALDYLVAAGDAREAIATLSAINGRHRPPPDWVLGVQDSENIEAEDFVDVSRTEQRLREDLRQIDRTGLRYSAFDLFGWFFLPQERQRELVAEFSRRGIAPLVYIVSFFGATSAEGMELQERGLVARRPGGAPYVYPTPIGPMVLLDFTNPEAKAFWRQKLRAALDLGAEGWMQDFGESVQRDMVFANGETGATMHNRYPVLYHRATREVLDEYEREHPERDIWVYTRSGFSSTGDGPGSPASEGGNFPGDNNTDFSRSNGLASAATDMLNRGIGGAYGYTTDVGGYLDSYTPTTTKELFLRWTAWATLSPALRIHNSLNGGTRHPWSYDDETLDAFRRFADLRERARPLIRRLWREAHATGIPIARPLWLEFPGDAEAARQDQQWMLGPDVLVAPVVTEGAAGREVYFPAGAWLHPETGERFSGPATIEVAAPLARLPYFFRAGSDPFHDAALKAGETLGLPSARRCVSRRRFEIRIRRWRGERVRSARVWVAGRRVRVRRRGGRVRATVDLRGRRAGIYHVRIVAVTRSGRRVRATRTYRTCTLRNRRWERRRARG